MPIRTQNKNHSQMVPRMQTRTKKGTTMTLEEIFYAIEERQETQSWKITKKVPVTNDIHEALIYLERMSKDYGYKHEYKIGVYQRIEEIQ